MRRYACRYLAQTHTQTPLPPTRCRLTIFIRHPLSVIMSPPQKRQVLLLSNDLLVGSQLSALARSHDSAFTQVSQRDDLHTEVGTHEVLLVVDLNCPSAQQLASIVQSLSSDHEDNPPMVVAFGPHVQTGKLAAARNAGCHKVVTRGAIAQEIGEWLQRS